AAPVPSPTASHSPTRPVESDVLLSVGAMPAPARADEVNRIDAAGGGDHPDDARATYIRDPAGVLADVALVSAGPGELRPVLERLADLTIEATGADRVSFFLLDDQRAHLRLWTATGR